MSKPLTVAMAQGNFLVGDIDGNCQKIIQLAMSAIDRYQAEVVVFPELTITGYPPEDLLLRPSLEIRVAKALSHLADQNFGKTYLIMGYPRKGEKGLYNVAGVLHEGRIIAEYRKQELPNYQVFDEKRYFVEGDGPQLLTIGGFTAGLSVCEDIWEPGPAAQASEAGAEILLNLNASPFDINKQKERFQVVSESAKQHEMAIFYTNLVGGQDELVFDGASMIVDAEGQKAFQAPTFKEGVYAAKINRKPSGGVSVEPLTASEPPKPQLQSIYDALVLGVSDYVKKNGFKGVVLGLSGGIDSALTLAIAADALGPEMVEAVMMPYQYTSQMSLEDAEEEARNLGVCYSVMPIKSPFSSFMEVLEPRFQGLPKDTTEENLQARCRGVLLMALSNKLGYLVLTTGNKSEMAVGYSTLYGDMAGGFDVLKDVPKTLVYELSKYRNQQSPVIPERVITRPPSAELAPDQVDQDSLPDYDILDEVLDKYIEQDFSAQQLIDEGFDAVMVNRVVRLVDINEYKRRQAPIGIRISQRGFGKDRRYPITNGWAPGE